MSKNYPRVLIIGQTFSGISGASITLRNLFEGWPKDKIAVATNNINANDKEAFIYCSNYYRFGQSEINIIKPFDKIYNIGHSKVLVEPIIGSEVKINKKKRIISRVKKYIKQFLIVTGLNSTRIKYNLSSDFIEWYNDFQPQVIYSALGDLDVIELVKLIKTIDNVPLVVHIWDDWPNTLANRTIFKSYWRNRIDKKFRLLLNETDLFLGISKEMSKDYKKIYGVDFIPFHNPIDIKLWVEKDDNIKNDNIINILYVGKINDNTIELLLKMAQVIDEKSRGSQVYIFNIYSPNRDKYKNIFKQYKHTVLKSAILHKEIISVIKKANVLFLPLAFDKRSIEYTRLSMPTKVSEYMISGVPIIVMAPKEIALTKYAIEDKWAEVVSENDVSKLSHAIDKLINNESYQIELVQRARAIAKKRHNAIEVRDDFRKLLKSVSQYGER